MNKTNEIKGFYAMGALFFFIGLLGWIAFGVFPNEQNVFSHGMAITMVIGVVLMCAGLETKVQVLERKMEREEENE